jgi:cytochrome bd ubiquinol oxidase subunit II
VYRAYGGGGAGPDHWWGHVFAVASTVTPFSLGVCGAALASGRASADDPTAPLTSPFGLVAGALAVAVTAFLAAVYLCRDASRSPATSHLVDGFRHRALASALLAGGLAMALLPLMWREAPVVAARFPTRGLPFGVLSALGGVGALVLVWRRRFAVARLGAAVAAAGVVWGWAAAQYPDLVVGQATVASAAAPAANLRALLVAVVAGMAVVVPALVLLLRVFSQPDPADQQR